MLFSLIWFRVLYFFKRFKFTVLARRAQTRNPELVKEVHLEAFFG
jgi:hypothetical protein